MNKRGLSGLVVTVLIILASVAGVSAIWAVIINPLIQNSIQASPLQEACTIDPFEVKSCQKITTSAGQPGYNIAYTLKPQAEVESLESLKIILELGDGSKAAGQGDTNIVPGDIKNIQLITFHTAKKVSMLGVLNIGENKQTSCTSTTLSCSEEIIVTSVNPEQQNATIENITLIENNMTTNNTIDSTPGYPGCYGMYQFYGGGDYQGLCDYTVNDRELCEQFNGWGNKCTWYEGPHCAPANQFAPRNSCFTITDEEECNNLNGNEGCVWVPEASCAGPRLNCDGMNAADPCNALEGCGWVEEPSCGDGQLTQDEECDGNQFYWYEVGNGGEYTYIGSLLQVNCTGGSSALIKQFTPGYGVSIDWNYKFKCNSECKLEEVTSSCSLCGNGVAEGGAGEECDGDMMDVGGYTNEGWQSWITPLGECTSYNRNFQFPGAWGNECPDPENPACYTSQDQPACNANCQVDLSVCE